MNVSSVAGKKGWADASAYCASKFGLTGLTEAQAAEGRAHGIRACVLYPGAMATHWGAWSPEERGEKDREEASPAKAPPPEGMRGRRRRALSNVTGAPVADRPGHACLPSGIGLAVAPPAP